MPCSWGLLTLTFSFGISGYCLSPFLVRLPLHLLITIIGWICAALDSLLYQDIAFFLENSCWRTFVIWQGSLELNSSVLIRSYSIGFCHLDYGPFSLKRSWDVYFCSRKPANSSLIRVPYNKPLTNPACSSWTEEYWPSAVSVRTSLRSVQSYCHDLGSILTSAALAPG